MGYLEKPLKISARRYIGNGARLAGWIMKIILSNTTGRSFCDLFSGTGIITDTALPYYKRIIINDFIYSNNVIHKAFFEAGKFNKAKIDRIIEEYNCLDEKLIPENYFSRNFGGKYFGMEIVKRVGYFGIIRNAPG